MRRKILGLSLGLQALHCTPSAVSGTETSAGGVPTSSANPAPTMVSPSESAHPATSSAVGASSTGVPVTQGSTVSDGHAPSAPPCVDCQSSPATSSQTTNPSDEAPPTSDTTTTNHTEGGSTEATSAPVGPDVSCQSDVSPGPRAAPLALSGQTFAHDPTMVQVGDTFFRYWTGDGVQVAQSSDLRNWTQSAPVYSDYPQWVNDWRSDHPGNTFNFPWAPDASYFGGKYHLYVSFSAFFGRNVSCIGHLTSLDPASNDWTDHGPIICSEGDQDYNAIDPDVGLDAEGRPWLAFGSFWGGIYSFPLDLEGNRQGSELTHLAWAEEIEAPVLFYRCGYYYLLVTWGLCCPGEGRSIDDLTYRVTVGRSENINGPYLDREGVPLTEGGGTLLVAGDRDQFAAAGHSDVLQSEGKFYHLYHAYRQRDAGAELRIVELPFDDEGWPVGGPP